MSQSVETIRKVLNDDGIVIENMRSNGDDGRAPRPVDFWFYGNEQPLQELMSELTSRGFKFADRTVHRSGVRMTLMTAVSDEVFERLTPDLLHAADRHGIEYDGWCTPVIRGQKLRFEQLSYSVSAKFTIDRG